MSQTAELRCRCREVAALLTNASRRTVNRAVCYCDDCQAFVHYLGRSDLLDVQGGSDIVQVAPASLVFQRGMDRIEGVRLTPRGLYRWYAGCCRTPVGNTLGPALPFVGILAHTFAVGATGVDAIFGKPVGAAFGKYAMGTAPEGSTRFNLGLTARMISKFLGWRLKGQTWPHPFFDRGSRAPKRPVVTVSRAERDALRPLCGPSPTPLR